MEYFSEDCGMAAPLIDDLMLHLPEDGHQHLLHTSLPRFDAPIDVPVQTPLVVAPSQVVSRPLPRSRSNSSSSGVKRPTTASPHIAKAAAAAASASSTSKRQRTVSSAHTPTSIKAAPTSVFPPSPESSSGSPPPNDQSPPTGSSSDASSYSDGSVSPDPYGALAGLSNVQAALSAGAVPFVAVPMAGPGGMQPWLAAPVFSAPIDAQQWMQKVAITRLPSMGGAPPEVAVSKEVKKSAHNVIERRYRNNINEKIAELRASIPTNASSGDDEKMNKGKILKRATEYIRFLRHANDGLRTENERLRDLVRSLGGSELLASIKMEPNTTDTMPSLDDDGADEDDEETSSNDTVTTTGITAAGGATSARHRLGDASRVMLMACLCLCLAFNPLATVLGHSTAGAITVDEAGGRRLASVGTDANADTWGSIWTATIRALSALFCLFVIMVSEPVLVAGSAELAGVSSLRHEADAALEKSQLGRARRLLTEALGTLGRPVPVTTTDHYLALTWHAIRQASHMLVPALWLDRFVANRTSHSRASFLGAAEAAVAYLKTQLLLPAGETDSGAVHGVYAALQAINLCESVGSSSARMTRVYALAALQLYTSLPLRLRPLSKHMLRMARRELAHVPVNEASATLAAVPWLQSADGTTFFMEGVWVPLLQQGAPVHLQDGPALDPLPRMVALWRERLLSNALAALVSHEAPATVTRLCEALHESAVAAGDADAEAWVSVVRAAAQLDANNESAYEAIERIAETVVPTCGAGSDPARDLLVLALLADAQVRQRRFETAMRACERVATALENDEAGCGCTSAICVGSLARTAAAERVFAVRITALARARADDGISSRFAPKLLLSAQRDADLLRTAFAAELPSRRATLALSRAVLRDAAGGAAHRTAAFYAKALAHAREARLPHVENYVRQQMEVFA